MYIRRKNAEHGRLKRTVKRSKVCDVLSSSYAQYLKLLLIWAFLITMDFLLEFRFEYFWPCWLLIRSLHDSFKYQGLIFSLFFLCIALTSDFICYLFIPVTWLFFLGSTYVWVQLIWHTERGVCLPTVALCFLFMYIEFAVRLREPRNLPFNIDLCRPFASHCIGYPVVTLGFGFKSYISYKFRLRKQKEVQTENSFYFNLLDESLPEECRARNLTSADQSEESISNALASSTARRRHLIDGSQDDLEFCEQNSESSTANDTLDNNSPKPSTSRKASSNQSTLSASPTFSLPSPKCNGLASTATSPSSSISSSNITTNAPGNSSGTTAAASSSASTTSSKKLSSSSTAAVTLATSTTASSSSGHHHQLSASTSQLANGSAVSGGAEGGCLTGSGDHLSGGGGGSAGGGGGASSATNGLENDVKRLKSELQSSRSCEAELRTQVSQMAQTDRLTRMELQQAKQEADGLQNRVNNLVQRIQTDKASVQLVERRLAEERKLRQTVETQLTAEKKARTQDQEMLAQQMAAKSECTEACKCRRRDLEQDVRILRRDLAQRDERLQGVEAENGQAEMLREERRRLTDTNLAMREENMHLTRSLKEENRIKQDLIAAYHGAMKDVTHLNSTLAEREYDILNLNMKLSMCNFGPGGSLQMGGGGGVGGPHHSLSSPHDQVRSDNCSSPGLSEAMYNNHHHRAMSPPHGAGCQQLQQPTSQQSNNNQQHDMYNSGHM